MSSKNTINIKKINTKNSNTKKNSNTNIKKKLTRPNINYLDNITVYDDNKPKTKSSIHNNPIYNNKLHYNPMNHSELPNSSKSIDYSIIKNSLEYYDKYQLEIQKILSNTEYIKIYYNTEINDEYEFYDSNHQIIFKSRIETLSMFIPSNNTWKWSWSVPFAQYKNTLISREILKYAFTLNSENDLFLKSALINSKIIIKNDYQLDTYLAISSLLSKKPFIFKIYLAPIDINDETKKQYNDVYLYEYKKIINSKDVKNYISVYVFAIDWKI